MNMVITGMLYNMLYQHPEVFVARLRCCYNKAAELRAQKCSVISNTNGTKDVHSIITLYILFCTAADEEWPCHWSIICQQSTSS